MYERNYENKLGGNISIISKSLCIMGLWQRLRALSVDAAPVRIFDQDLNLLYVINNLKLSHSQMQKNNPAYILPENFTVMTPEELEVLLQQVDSEHLAVLTRLS